MANELRIGRMSPMKRLINLRLSGSFLLVLMTFIVILLANTPCRDDYFAILEMPVVLQVGNFDLFEIHGAPMTLAEFANDVLMVLFFLHVGLGIKQEMLVGELSSIKKGLFPVVAACGGVLFPILIYMTVCHTGPGAHGMTIPMATDIAFSLAVLSAVKGVPPALKTFLATLAVADDIAGILVIAIFYSHGINLLMLGIGVVLLGFLYLLSRRRVRYLWVYYLGLLFVWYFFLRSGIHTTVAGVLVAMLIPAKSLYKTSEMVDVVKSRLSLFPEGDQRTRKGGIAMLPNEQLLVAQSIQEVTKEAISPVQRMETQLNSFVNYFILPLFAFVNAGISFQGFDWNDFLNIPLAIILGLVLGKPIGVYLFSRLYLLFTKSPMPKWMNRSELLGVAMICGIGFTVSLFMATLTFRTMPDLLNEAKVGIFSGSLFAGIMGYIYLTLHYRYKQRHQRKAASN